MNIIFGPRSDQTPRHIKALGVSLAGLKKIFLIFQDTLLDSIRNSCDVYFVGSEKHVAHYSTGLATCDHAFLVFSSVSGPSPSSLLAKLSVVNVGGGTSSNP